MEEQRDKQNRKGKRRERTRAKDAADLFASSSPRLCSICCPKRPHHRQRSPPRPLATSPRVREGRPLRPVLVDAIATPRHHLATDRPANSRAAPRRSAILPACPPRPRPLPLCQVVRVWRRASQGGRSPASHPAAPLHPAGVPRHICGHLRRGAGSGQPYQGGGADLRESLFRDFLRGCIALNINYLFSPNG